MIARTVITALVTIAACVAVLAEPKAYDLVRYRGTADGLTIAFEFGDGYPQASKLRITNAGGHTSRKFLLDDSGEMRFVPENDRRGGDAVTLKMSMDDAAPAKVEGAYRHAGKTIVFVLTRG